MLRQKKSEKSHIFVTFGFYQTSYSVHKSQYRVLYPSVVKANSYFSLEYPYFILKYTLMIEIERLIHPGKLMITVRI